MDPVKESPSIAGASGLYTTSASHSADIDCIPLHAYASSACSHIFSVPRSTTALYAENMLERHSAEHVALAALCRTVFQSDPIIRSNIDRRFNAEYQDLHDKVPRDYLEIKQRELDLSATLYAFRQYSEIVSELIILQQQLPAEMRVIDAAAALGGHAGGEKFKVGHVVFKFARDWKNIYGAFTFPYER